MFSPQTTDLGCASCGGCLQCSPGLGFAGEFAFAGSDLGLGPRRRPPPPPRMPPPPPRMPPPPPRPPPAIRRVPGASGTQPGMAAGPAPYAQSGFRPTREEPGRRRRRGPMGRRTGAGTGAARAAIRQQVGGFFRSRAGAGAGAGSTRGRWGGRKFSKIKSALAQRLGVQVQQANAGYSYPEIPQQVEQGIPNYYAESRQLRGLNAIPEDAGNFARQIGRYIYDSLPSDPDRGGTVEETIANILDYAANRAHAAQDQLNADFLAKIAGKWRQVISKKSPAINPDAPIERNDNQGETGYLGALPAPLSSPFWLSAAAGVAAGILGSRKSKAKSRDFLAYGVGGGLTAYLVLLAIQASGDTDK